MTSPTDGRANAHGSTPPKASRLRALNPVLWLIGLVRNGTYGPKRLLAVVRNRPYGPNAGDASSSVVQKRAYGPTRLSAVADPGHDAPRNSLQAPPRSRAFALIALTGALLGASAVTAHATVTVNLEGAGAGKVTSNTGSPQINCVWDGSAKTGTCTNAPPSDFVTKTNITVIPAAGSVFDGWTTTAGACVSRTTPCTLDTSLGASYTIKARFIPTPDPAHVTTGSADPGGLGAVLAGQVDRNGGEVIGCRFDYGLTVDYGKGRTCAESLAAINSASGDIALTARSGALLPNTTYHFRLVVTNLGGATPGADRVFTTGPAPADNCPNAAIRAAQGPDVQLLPDCMALEKVSVDDKGGQLASTADNLPIRAGFSEDGNRIVYVARAALAGAPSFAGVYGQVYVAVRGAAGWVTHSTSAPTTAGDNEAAPLLVDDLTGWLTGRGTPDQHDFARFYVNEDRLDGTSEVWTQQLGPTDSNNHAASTGIARWVGMTPDASHVYFVPGDTSTALISGDPSPTGTVPNAYVLHKSDGQTAQVSLLARDSAGTAWGGACGATFGAGTRNSAPSGRIQGAVSGNGSQVLFSTRPSQPQFGACNATLPVRIMRRTESGSTVTISELLPSLPAAGSDFFEGASNDGTKVFLTTRRALVPTDTDSSASECTSGSDNPAAIDGCDLYLYDSDPPAGQPSLVQVSRGTDDSPTPGAGAAVTGGVVAISTDGSHVYFVANGVLTTAANAGGRQPVAGQPNLYVYERDGAFPAGRTAFIGTLDATTDRGIGSAVFGVRNPKPEDVMAVPTGSSRSEAGGDGHILFFTSGAPLLAGDDDGGRLDAYRYDSSTGELLRLSTSPDAGSDDGPFDVSRIDIDRFQDPQQGRWASDDGNTAVFTVPDLFSGDTSDTASSYLWRKDGATTRVAKLPNPIVAAQGLWPRSSVSRDGSQVAFAADDALLPQDGDVVRDVYVARVNGGYLTPAPSPECALSGTCQSAGAAPTAPVLGGTAGPGNPAAPTRARVSLKPISAATRKTLAAGRRANLTAQITGPGVVIVRGLARLHGKSTEVFRIRRSATLAGPVTVGVRLSAPARRALAEGRRLTLRVVATLSAATEPATKTLSLRRGRSAAQSGSSRRIVRGSTRGQQA